MNKEELVQEISKKANVTQKEAAEVLSSLVDTIQKTVAKGKKVTLVGFGTFEPRKRAARTGRNPQTGKEIKTSYDSYHMPVFWYSVFGRLPAERVVSNADYILIANEMKRTMKGII